MGFKRSNGNGQTQEGPAIGVGMPTESGGEGAGIYGDDVLDRYLSSPQAANIAKHFISPGDGGVRDLEMRGQYKDWKQARAMNEYLHLCREFDDKDGEDQLLDYIASLCAIDGERIKILAKVLSRAPMEEFNRKPDKFRRPEG